MGIETCCKCDGPTRASEDDELWDAVGEGPYCGDCFKDAPQECAQCWRVAVEGKDMCPRCMKDRDDAMAEDAWDARRDR